MKLVTCLDESGRPRVGVLTADGRAIALLQAGAVHRDGQARPEFTDMLTLLRGGPRAMDAARDLAGWIVREHPDGTLLPLEGTRLLAPVPVPESIRDCMAFEQHIINATRAVGLGKLAFLDEALERWLGRKRTLAYLANRAWYRAPVYYKSNRFSVSGPDADIRMPPDTRRFDYELEWGVFIGEGGHDITEAGAAGHIAGYTIFNDFSARDTQLAEMRGRLGPAKGKDFDTGNAIGPCLVTPDEIPDPYALTMRARVNGEEWSLGSSADMHWSFEDIIAHVSRSETLYPGEFIGSGTCSGPEGRGCGLEMGKVLSAGDLVELEVERIGILRNRVMAAGDAASWEPVS